MTTTEAELFLKRVFDENAVLVFTHRPPVVVHRFGGAYRDQDRELVDYTICGVYGGRWADTNLMDKSKIRPCRKCFKEDA